MPNIGKQLRAINMDAVFEKVRKGEFVWFVCKNHKNLAPMNRKKAREHYMLYK